MEEQKIYIVTQLGPSGETGVQTHFNAFADFARSSQVETDIITVGQVNRIIRGPLRRIGILLGWLKAEWGFLWDRWVRYALLVYLLHMRLRHCRAQRKIIYAQDPLSAKVALKLRDIGHILEVVLVIHFNISEAYEIIEKGLDVDNGPLYRHFFKVEKEVLPRVDRILFPSSFSQRQVQSRLPEIAKIPMFVIPNFISIPNNQEAGKINSEKRDLIAIGSLEPRKNQEFLLRVLACAHQLGFKYRLTLVGDGPSKKSLEDLANELGLSQYVFFTGFLQNGASLIANHRAYVHASRMESFGVVIVEALASSRPVFAAPVGGITEVFSNGVEGVFWDLTNPQESAKLLINVLENQEAYRDMCLVAREHYLKNFSSEVLGAKWLGAVLGKNTSKSNSP